MSKSYLKILISFLLVIFFSGHLFSNQIEIEIIGNNNTDDDVILSLLEKKPVEINDEYSNYIIKKLNSSNQFENVSVEISNTKYIITIKEYININKIYFQNNERLNDDELLQLSEELNLINLNPLIIENYISEIKKIYDSFGYTNALISYSDNKIADTNTADLYFQIEEGKITKINKILFRGNVTQDSQDLKNIIKSKTKNLINIFANNNYKKYVVENDLRILSNFYKNNGYVDVDIKFTVEYLNNNKVNIYFEIDEGNLYKFSSIDIIDNENLLNKNLVKKIKENINSSYKLDDNFSLDLIYNLKDEISELILENDVKFFEIKSLENIENFKVDILFAINSIEPKYTNQINIYGNSRTFDRVIRRELNISEGDSIHSSQIQNINKKLKSLNLFESVEVIEKVIDDETVDIEIVVKEKQTGTVNAGLSVGTLDGFAVVAGLSERNFYGTGRSLNALVNTSENKTEFTFETTDRLMSNNNMDVSYKVNYKEQDFSSVSSYNLDTFTTGFGLTYDLNKKIRHNIKLEYLLKNYIITNSDKVASSIASSSGESVSYLLSNNFFFSTLNSNLMPKNGRQFIYNNLIETPTSSSNGFFKNTITYKNYNMINKNIFSLQVRLGNISSLNSNDILTDDKFSLGGRWLRGFDNYGAGPRNSAASYVGGNNLIVSKLDYSRQLSNNSDFPIYLNLFNDYGLLWDNKTEPTHNDNNLRSSVGFGIKYYSPIGPIGFSWGFPIADEEYDIKRMFLFTVGNID